ncbi:c-type cytochrome [Pseudomonas sp. R2.Fl]|nr:c-type cytochrome [Pseudomonas sp. R2.Fl]
MTGRRRRNHWIGSALGLGFIPAAAIVLMAGFVPASGEGGGDTVAAHQRDALFPLPPAPKLDPAKASLGKRLFYDPVLSKRQMISCGSCHNLSTGGTIHVKRTIGYEGRMHDFNAPTIFNTGNNYRLGWRGKFTSLAAQNESVLLDENLMANTWAALLPRLAADEGYRTQFKTTYGKLPDRQSVLDALVTFQRSLATPDAPFDRFLKGEKDAISAQQRRGYELFLNYGCVSCHQGSNIGGNMFQIFGIFAEPVTKMPASPASGPPRRPSINLDEERDVFRVPSLRNVEVTAPYFHDGRAETLTEAVAVMGRSQLGRELAENDVAAIVDFLKSLTGDYNGKRLEASSAEDRR